MGAILHLGNLEFRGNGQTQASFEQPEQAHTVAKVHESVCSIEVGVYLLYYVYVSACTCMRTIEAMDNLSLFSLCCVLLYVHVHVYVIFMHNIHVYM